MEAQGKIGAKGCTLHSLGAGIWFMLSAGWEGGGRWRGVKLTFIQQFALNTIKSTDREVQKYICTVVGPQQASGPGAAPHAAAAMKIKIPSCSLQLVSLQCNCQSLLPCRSVFWCILHCKILPYYASHRDLLVSIAQEHRAGKILYFAVQMVRVKLETYSAEKFAEDDQDRCTGGPRDGQGRPGREEGAGPGLGRIPGRC